MRNFEIFAVAILAASGVGAAEAAAQSQPAPPNWGFGYERFGDVRFMRVRVQRIEGRIRQMDWRHQITGRTIQGLIDEANAIQRHLRNDAASGLSAQQAEVLTRRIMRLERQINAAYAERDRRLQDPYAYHSPDVRRDADEDLDGNGRDDRWETDWRLDPRTLPPR